MIPNTRSVVSVAPIVLLGLALIFLLWKELPTGNEQIVTAIVSGLLGYLSRPSGATKPEK